MKETQQQSPFIENAFDNFLGKVTFGQTNEVPGGEKLMAYQAFYAGFSAACALLNGVHVDDREKLIKQIKRELSVFSEVNREAGRKHGIGHVRVSSDPSRPAMFVSAQETKE